MGWPIDRVDFGEWLEQIREIRASERWFCLKIKDICEQCSIDYNAQAEITRTFFATVQNNLTWAVAGQTAADIIAPRADAARSSLRLTARRHGPRGPHWPRHCTGHEARLCETVDRYLRMSTLSHMPASGRTRLILMARRRKVLTASDARRAGIHSQQLTRLVAEGVLERIGRGRYRTAGQAVTEHHGLALAAAAAPGGVICLLSALSFHGIGSQLPWEVWIAVQRGRRAPTMAQPPIRVVRLSGAAFTEGVETHRIEGQTVRVYSIAKTLADLFKFRNRVGIDVALEALREAWRERRFTMDALDRAARVCRVERVMRPYVEGIVA